jgi:hypothetical protein
VSSEAVLIGAAVFLSERKLLTAKIAKNFAKNVKTIHWNSGGGVAGRTPTLLSVIVSWA